MGNRKGRILLPRITSGRVQSPADSNPFRMQLLDARLLFIVAVLIWICGEITKA